MKSITSTIVVMAISASLAQAATIVNWGAPGGDDNILTAEAGNAAGENATPATYNASTVIAPLDGTKGYDRDAAGQTRVFYGAQTNAGPDILNESGVDQIQMVSNFGTSPAAFSNMIVWQSSDFLALNATAELQSFTIEFQKRNASANTTATLLLETSTGWWQSDQSATHAGYASWTVADISTLTWSAFNQFGVTGGTGSADIGDVNSVGFHFAAPAGANNWNGTQIRYVNITAVPEPSSASLLGIACFTLGLLHRRRR